MLIIHRELVKGSGLESILSGSELLIVGTGAMVKVNHLKQAQFCLQESVCAIYAKLREAQASSGLTLSPVEWLDLKAAENPMCPYWKMILDLQIDILLFIPVNTRIQLPFVCLVPEKPDEMDFCHE